MNYSPQSCLWLLLLCFSKSAALAGDPKFVVIPWAQMEDDREYIYPSVIQDGGKRFLYFSGEVTTIAGPRIRGVFLRSGVKSGNTWVYSEPRPALIPGVSGLDASGCSRPSVVEVKLTVPTRTGIATFNYLMSYAGSDTARVPKARQLFAVSETIEGPWIKVGELFLKDENMAANVGAVTLLAGPTLGTIRMMHLRQEDGTWIPYAQVVNVQDLSIPKPLRPIRITTDGLLTGSGDKEVRVSFPKFCKEGENLLMVRTVMQKPTLSPTWTSDVFDVSRIPLIAATTGKSVRWSGVARTRCDTFPYQQAGFFCFVTDSKGQLVKDDHGRFEVFGTFHADSTNHDVGRIHSVLISP